MANTYIHTLPDVLATDPNAYTILDYENQFEEYVTAKVTLASLADFTNNTFLNSTPYLNSLSATTWVNANSANGKFQSLFLNLSGIAENQIPLNVVGDQNSIFEIKFQNANDQNFSRTQLSFLNDDENTNFNIGVLGSNFEDTNFTLGGAKNVSYIQTTNSKLGIGTVGNDNDIIFYMGGPFLGNERFYIKQTPAHIGVNTRNPNATFTVNGIISSNNFMYDGIGNSEQWNECSAYVKNISSVNDQSNTFITQNSSNIMLKTGSSIFGPIFTTKTLTSLFVTDEFVTKRYVDAMVLETTVSGNFIPSLYYTKTEIDDFLINPTSVYNTTCSLSSDWNSVYTNWFINSSKFENLNTVVNTGSASWYSVYSYINSTSSLEEDQNETTTYVLNNSANINATISLVGNTSSNWDSVYSSWNSISSFDTESRNTFIGLSSRFVQATTYVENNSANIQGISNVVNSFSSNSIDVNTFVNGNSSNIQSVYTHYNSQSANFATRNYVNGGFLPLSGGDVIGELFATQFGVGNTEVVTGNLGTVVRRMQIFDINGNSIGFIPIYNSIT
jgi:hypothetical protein